MGANGIPVDVLAMAHVISRVSNAMVNVPALPDLAVRGKLQPIAIREPSFHKLNGLRECNPCGWRKDHMNMIRHNDEFMKFEFSLLAIGVENLQEQLRGGSGLKNGCALPRFRCDEPGAAFKDNPVAGWFCHEEQRRLKPPRFHI